MSIVEHIKKEIICASEAYKDRAADHYDFWNEHIKYVYAESSALAERYGADTEIVALGALLHDIAMIKQTGGRQEHHMTGARLAEALLRQYGYPEDKLRQVVGCVLHHRSSKEAENIEEICVADADILSHFDNIPMTFNFALHVCHVNSSELRGWLKAAFEKDFYDLSERTRTEFAERYEMICKVVLGE